MKKILFSFLVLIAFTGCTEDPKQIPSIKVKTLESIKQEMPKHDSLDLFLVSDVDDDFILQKKSEHDYSIERHYNSDWTGKFILGVAVGLFFGWILTGVILLNN